MIGPIFRALLGSLSELASHPLKERIWGPVVHHARKYFTTHTIVRRVAIVASPLMAFVFARTGSELQIHHWDSILLALPFCAAILISICAIACEINWWWQNRFRAHFANHSIDTVETQRKLTKEERRKK